MSTYSLEQHTTVRAPKPLRLWIVESLVVLGILGFAYLAVTMDASLFSAPTAQSESATDPLLDFVR